MPTTFKLAVRPKLPIETYGNPAAGISVLRYSIDDRTGQHVVKHKWSVSESSDIYRHDSIEDARETWKRLRALLARRGYTRIGRDGGRRHEPATN